MSKNFNPVSSPISSPVKKLAFGRSLRALQANDDWIVQEAPAAPWFWWLSSFAWIHGLAKENYSPGDFVTYVTQGIGTLVINRATFLAIAEKLIKREISGRSSLKSF